MLRNFTASSPCLSSESHCEPVTISGSLSKARPGKPGLYLARRTTHFEIDRLNELFSDQREATSLPRRPCRESSRSLAVTKVLQPPACSLCRFSARKVHDDTPTKTRA